MEYVFVSHASEDKPLIRPLVEALAMQDVKLWLDRPHFGDSHFNLEHAFIERYGIRGLAAGESWLAQIPKAMRGAGAVLVCLSKAFPNRMAARPEFERTVLIQEILIAMHDQKLVACVVDDLDISTLPRNWGLIDLSAVQAERIRPSLLRLAVDEALSAGGSVPEPVSAPAKIQWEVVRKLVRDVNAILDRKNGWRPPSPQETAAARTTLAGYPIGPMVRFDEIPVELVDMLAELFRKPDQAEGFFTYAMQLRQSCNPERHTDDQILVRASEVAGPDGVPPIQYWADVLATAGLKSRRTLAALCIAPRGPSSRRWPPGHERLLLNFLEWLKQTY